MSERDAIDYPDVPLSVALANSNLPIQERLWALEAINERRALRAERDAALARVKEVEGERNEESARANRKESLASQYARDADDLSRRCAAQLEELKAITAAIGTNEGHSSVDHIKKMARDYAASQEALGIYVDGYAKMEQQRDALKADNDRLRGLLAGVIESLDVIDQTMPAIARGMVHGAFVVTEAAIRKELSR